MKILGNFMWLLFGGIFFSMYYFIIGIICCVTIIGIPVGLQLFKLGKLILWPFGRKVVTNFDKHPVLNIIWVVFFGWQAALGSLIVAVILYISIIGIPFGLQWMKLASAQLLPFGATIHQT